jgi:hypothetical protein
MNPSKTAVFLEENPGSSKRRNFNLLVLLIRIARSFFNTIYIPLQSSGELTGLLPLQKE